jgi:hypothetical protein
MNKNFTTQRVITLAQLFAESKLTLSELGKEIENLSDSKESQVTNMMHCLQLSNMYEGVIAQIIYNK